MLESTSFIDLPTHATPRASATSLSLRFRAAPPYPTQFTISKYSLHRIQHTLQLTLVVFVEDVAALEHNEYYGSDAQRCYAQGLR